MNDASKKACMNQTCKISFLRIDPHLACLNHRACIDRRGLFWNYKDCPQCEEVLQSHKLLVAKNYIVRTILRWRKSKQIACTDILKPCTTEYSNHANTSLRTHAFQEYEEHKGSLQVKHGLLHSCSRTHGFDCSIIQTHEIEAPMTIPERQFNFHEKWRWVVPAIKNHHSAAIATKDELQGKMLQGIKICTATTDILKKAEAFSKTYSVQDAFQALSSFKPPVNLSETAFLSETFPELWRFLSAPCLSKNVFQHIPFPFYNGELTLSTAEVQKDFDNRMLLRDAILNLELIHVAKSIISEFSRNTNNPTTIASLGAFCQLMTMTSESIAEKCAITTCVNRQCLKERLLNKASVKYELEDSTLFAEKLFENQETAQIGQNNPPERPIEFRTQYENHSYAASPVMKRCGPAEYSHSTEQPDRRMMPDMRKEPFRNGINKFTRKGSENNY